MEEDSGDGGAIYNDHGDLILSGCVLTNHTARGRGGAIFSRGGHVRLDNTTGPFSKGLRGTLARFSDMPPK